MVVLIAITSPIYTKKVIVNFFFRTPGILWSNKGDDLKSRKLYRWQGIQSIKLK